MAPKQLRHLGNHNVKYHVIIWNCALEQTSTIAQRHMFTIILSRCGQCDGLFMQREVKLPSTDNKHEICEPEHNSIRWMQYTYAT